VAGNGTNTATFGCPSTTKVYLGSATSAAIAISNGTQIAGTFYSAAGTPLPSCAAGTLLQRVGVSDAAGVATAQPVAGSAYASGGTFTMPVICIFNSTGSVYTWIID
jgi:hypothetical protein